MKKFLSTLAVLVTFASHARAEDALPPPPTLVPQLLTLTEADRIFHTSGLDLLIADAQVTHTEGDALAARAIANPNLSASVGYALDYTQPPMCVGCSPLQLSFQISDNNALFDVMVGKHGLRSSSARSALAAARLGRVDAERVVRGQVRQAYAQLVVAKVGLDFAKDVQTTMTKSLDLNKLRYPALLDEGGLARIEVQKLEADQVVDQAQLTVRQAQVALAFLLGVRGVVPDFDVERTLAKFSVPSSLASATEASLVALAESTRADLRAWTFQRESATDALSLARRNRFPDIGVFANYTQFGTGPGAVQPPTLTFGLSFNLPVFYQQQGEVRRAEADVQTAVVSREKAHAQVLSDVSTAFATYISARDLVQRMESTILDRAKKARDIVDLQYRGGTATLMDFLDAERQWIAANQEHLQDLALYWGAVFALEQAVGVELK